MRIAYYPDTDSLYIDLGASPSKESRETSPGLVVDYDATGNVTGIDIDKANQKLDLGQLVLSGVPVESRRRTS